MLLAVSPPPRGAESSGVGSNEITELETLGAL